MEIQTRKEQNATIVTITGRLDAITAPECDQRMRALADVGEVSAVVDCGGLEYISSAGLRVLLVSAKLLKGKGGQLRIANVKGAVREVLVVSGFDTIFPMDESVAAALGALA